MCGRPPVNHKCAHIRLNGRAHEDEQSRGVSDICCGMLCTSDDLLPRPLIKTTLEEKNNSSIELKSEKRRKAGRWVHDLCEQKSFD